MEDNTMSETNDLLLQMLFRNYDEEVSRNELIDNKNSQMIVLTGTMLTLQATLFTTGLLNEFVYNKIPINLRSWILGLFICSLITSVISMIFFIWAYKFVGIFHQSPTANYVKNSYNKKRSKSEIIEKTLTKMPNTINDNKKLMSKKVKLGSIGFTGIIINIIFILLFVSLLIYCFV